MFAVIKTGGKQYRVEPGSVISIEKIAGEVGDKIELNEVLLLNDGAEIKVGRPLVSGATVSLEIVNQTKGPKLKIFKKIRRHGKQLRKGHRQELTQVKVAAISG